MKNKTVLKDISKWHAKAQELNQTLYETPTPKVSRGNKSFKEEKVQMLNKVVKPFGSTDDDNITNEAKDNSATTATILPDPSPTIKTMEDVILELKQKYELPNTRICRLCKRDLGTPEKLKIHFNLSKLHEVSKVHTLYF